MATLKDHQQAMVDLLAPGSGIPASASRLAHAMHDVLGYMVGGGFILDNKTYVIGEVNDATTPGLNDKALAGDLEACRPKATRFNVNINLADMDEVKMTLQNMQSHLDGVRDSKRAAERRVKELENTVKQLRASNAKLKQERDDYKAIAETHAGWIRKLEGIEQAECRKPYTQLCEHKNTYINAKDRTFECPECGFKKSLPIDFDLSKVNI